MTVNPLHLDDPFERLPAVPAFTVDSSSLVAGAQLPMRHVHTTAGGQNQSPELSWKGFPAETRGFAITCFDPDAPTGSGFWHWTLVNIPAPTLELPTGAGSDSSDLDGAFHIINDFGSFDYAGAAPPPGDGEHRYVFTVHALSAATLGIDQSVTSALARFMIVASTIARATLVTHFSSDVSA